MMKTSMIDLSENIPLLKYKNLSYYRKISHFTTTRRGGISSGNYEALNLSIYSGDDPMNVEENRHLLSTDRNIYPENLIIPYQVHGDEISILSSDFQNYSKEEKNSFLSGVDALITDLSGFCIGVTVADCTPILLYDPEFNVVAAVHAGWRGTVKRIVQKTVCRMCQSFGSDPKNIVAAIGPCIGKDAFEVGDEVFDAFKSEGFPMDEISFFNDGASKYHIDLAKANEFCLTEGGVLASNIESAGICTFTSSDLFFSARKLGINSGRFISGIMLNK